MAEVDIPISTDLVADEPLPIPPQIDRLTYEAELRGLQVELVKMQRWMLDAGHRLVVVFEGRDAAGKGGTIKRLLEHLNPRSARHVALAAPSDLERGQWYFQRYVAHLPTRGEIACFDRSWYNRAGVERVMGFCTREEYLSFIQQVPEFERQLTDSGIQLVKIWLDINRSQQRKRMHSRRSDPLKSWKLSAIDLEAEARWDDYTVARNDMLVATDTRHAPWMAVNSNRKRVARLNCIRHVLVSVPYEGKDPELVVAPDPEIVASAREVFEPWLRARSF